MAGRCSRAAAVPARSRCSTGPTSNGRRSGRRRSEYRSAVALLTFNRAPDRLGWLSVDADECPPHVFGVTEADRLRDAFDRFGSRLYAASGQIDAEPFHHTCGRGARLRPECAAELAQAHADLLRQTLDGEPFGDVIASIANGSGNPVIFWRQIDGSCELRLSAMAAMVDDEVLCHAFGDGKPWSSSIKASARSIPAVMPAEVHTLPSRQKMRSASTRMDGYSRCRRAAYRQCVVARRPSNNPAAARTNTPVQTLAPRRNLIA